MKNKEYAIVRPSELPIADKCDGYLKLRIQLDKEGRLDENTNSSYAQDGTDIHSIAQTIMELYKQGEYEFDGFNLTKKIDPKVKEVESEDESKAYKEALDAVEKTLQFFYEQDLERGSEGLVAPEHWIFTERFESKNFLNVTLQGTADVKYRNIIADYKTGFSKVKPDSMQLKAYAYLHLVPFHLDVILAVVQKYDGEHYAVEHIKMRNKDIVQEVEAVLMKSETGGEFTVGNHCKYCRCKGNCPKYNIKEVNLTPGSLASITPEEAQDLIIPLEHILDTLKLRITNHLKNGNELPKYYLKKTVRNNRSFADYSALSERLISEGIDPWDKKELTPAGLEKRLGKHKFEKIIKEGDVLISPTESISLVRKEEKEETPKDAYTDKQMFEDMMGI